MDQIHTIPPHLLFTYQNKDRLEEARLDTANYYITNRSFEYEYVMLMEIAYIICKEKNELNYDEIHSIHNRLCKILIINSIPFCHKDIRQPPYFRQAAFEYWVTPEIAIQLLTYYLDTKLSPTLKIKPNKARRSKDPNLMSYVKHHAAGETYGSWLKMMTDQFIFNDLDDYNKRKNEVNTDCSHDDVKYSALLKDGKDKYKFIYKIKLGSGKYSSPTTVAALTVRGYFHKARKEIRSR